MRHWLLNIIPHIENMQSFWRMTTRRHRWCCYGGDSFGSARLSKILQIQPLPLINQLPISTTLDSLATIPATSQPVCTLLLSDHIHCSSRIEHSDATTTAGAPTRRPTCENHPRPRLVQALSSSHISGFTQGLLFRLRALQDSFSFSFTLGLAVCVAPAPTNHTSSWLPHWRIS